MWVDELVLTFQAGRGGDGVVSFRQEKCVEWGGPDGGNGGKGGDVIVEADRCLNSLLTLRGRKLMKAWPGANGARANRSGKAGRDLVVKVPVGTVIRRATDNSVIADMHRHGERHVVAAGGRGGRGNKAYAGPINRSPKFRELGERGKKVDARLEVRLMADVGLVGLPNAGKSTLLSRLSAARPKIADYPFTTLEPMLGLVERSGATFTVADLPGLIRGAHAGRGLGLTFLRHVERTRIILHLVDAASPTAADDYAVIREELEAYGRGLSEKKAVVALTKLDAGLPDPWPIPDAIGISAHSGVGLDELCITIGKLLAEIPPIPPLRSEIRMEEELPVTVRRDGDHFILEGDAVQRYLDRRAPDDFMSWRRFWQSLVRWGVADEMKALGVKNRDTVVIGDRVFEFLDEDGDDAPAPAPLPEGDAPAEGAPKEGAPKEGVPKEGVPTDDAPKEPIDPH